MTEVMGVLRRKSDPAADGKDGGRGSAYQSRAEEQRGWGHRPALGKLGGWLLLFPEYRVMEMLISFSLSVYNTQTSWMP